MRRFSELEFKPHPTPYFGGVQAQVLYPNGYGASVIKSPHSYGGSQGLYELAVLKGDTLEESIICYATPITDDVCGHLTEDDVTELLNQIYLLRADKDRAVDGE